MRLKKIHSSHQARTCFHNWYFLCLENIFFQCLLLFRSCFCTYLFQTWWEKIKRRFTIKKRSCVPRPQNQLHILWTELTYLCNGTDLTNFYIISKPVVLLSSYFPPFISSFTLFLGSINCVAGLMVRIHSLPARPIYSCC